MVDSPAPDRSRDLAAPRGRTNFNYVTNRASRGTKRVDRTRGTIDSAGMSTLVRIVVLTCVVVVPAAAEGMKDGDRQRLLAHLDMTENWLVSELDGLTTQQ